MLPGVYAATFPWTVTLLQKIRLAENPRLRIEPGCPSNDGTHGRN